MTGLPSLRQRRHRHLTGPNANVPGRRNRSQEGDPACFPYAFPPRCRAMLIPNGRGAALARTAQRAAGLLADGGRELEAGAYAQLLIGAAEVALDRLLGHEQ